MRPRRDTERAMRPHRPPEIDLVTRAHHIDAIDRFPNESARVYCTCGFVIDRAWYKDALAAFDKHAARAS